MHRSDLQKRFDFDPTFIHPLPPAVDATSEPSMLKVAARVVRKSSPSP